MASVQWRLKASYLNRRGAATERDGMKKKAERDGWGGPKGWRRIWGVSWELTIEGRGGAADNDVTAPPGILDQVLGFFAQRIRGGRDRKLGENMWRQQVRESLTREETVHYTGSPPLRGEESRMGKRRLWRLG